jgi:LuxR family maltose regulon positive regulatory protein
MSIPAPEVATLPATVLATKLFVPRLRPKLVQRPHLVNRLEQARQLGHKLTVVLGPAGSGKTTLVSEWLAQWPADDPTVVAWLSLDRADSEPRRFVAHSMAALRTAQPELDVSVIPHEAVSPRKLVTILVNQMVASPARRVFVLDDYHLIESSLLHTGVSFLVENLPPQVHMIIISRQELPFSLARLRGRDQITELRAEELRFSAVETTQFLQHSMGLSLTADDVSVLETQLEGWVAGLQLMALSLRGQPAPDSHQLTLAVKESRRYIFDYLLEEVLQRQPVPIQQFLLRTAILDRLCGPLCDALLEHNGDSPGAGQPGRDTLDYLEQANMFVVPLDTAHYWYRYHHFFSDLLRHRLSQTLDAQEVVRLHDRASDWYEQQGLFADAMEHALEAGNVGRMTRLARQTAAPILSRGELAALLGWLEALPEELVRSKPGISLLKVWAMLLAGQFEVVEAQLQTVAQAFESDPVSTRQPGILGEIEALRATVAYFQRDIPTAVKHFRKALDHLPPDNMFLRGAVAQSLGSAYSWSGQVVEATRAFTESETIGRKTGNLQIYLVARRNLGQLQREQGHLRLAEELYREGLAEVADHADLLTATGRLHIGLAEIMYERNQLAAAIEHIETGLTATESRPESSTQLLGRLLLARIYWQQGRTDEAWQAIWRASYLAQRISGSYYWARLTQLWQARLWLWQGNLQETADWLIQNDFPADPLPAEIPYTRENVYLLLVRLLLAHARQPAVALPTEIIAGQPFDTATAILARIRQAATATQRVGRLLETICLQALLAEQQGQQRQALDYLRRALALGEAEGYIRTFVDEGVPLVSLLRQAAGQNIQLPASYTARLVAALDNTGAEEQLVLPLDPLSDRELEILRLIATGMSNKELAERLILTVGTIKWHLSNIYSKLNVRSRTQAVAIARSLGLI